MIFRKELQFLSSSLCTFCLKPSTSDMQTGGCDALCKVIDTGEKGVCLLPQRVRITKRTYELSGKITSDGKTWKEK